ncbi:FRG domain-containing protein [Pectobacterium versatile]|nr:FRG domain-containing protein [Pectobacterium versatile]
MLAASYSVLSETFMRIETVANVEEAIELASNLKREGKYNWFRGQVRADWMPSSSMERKLKYGAKLDDLNKDIARFLDWARLVPELAYLADTANQNSLFAILQHYGYPTTYIDFTTDPSVAGFFASDTSQQLDESTVSAILCLNTEHLVNFYREHAKFIGADIKIEPVSVDVSNLWRLQAQHGHFLYVNHDWYRIYDMDRIEFPWTGLPAYPSRHQIYPTQKSHLEQLLDEFKVLEQRRRGQKDMHKMIDDLIRKGVKVKIASLISDPARYEKSVFAKAPVQLESWSKAKLSPWLFERQEQFHDVVGNSIDIRVRSGLGAPSAHLQVRTAFLGALSRESGLRARATVWKVDGLVGQLEVDQYLCAIQSAWNGMRNLPYKDDDIAEAMGALTQLFLIGNCDSMVVHIRNSSFKKWMPDAFEIEFGNDILNTISRASCSGDALFQCLDSSWRDSCKDQKMVSSAHGAFYACSKPDCMFEFEAFARLFARQIIPAQLAQKRPVTLFNPAKLDFVGNP